MFRSVVYITMRSGLGTAKSDECEGPTATSNDNYTFWFRVTRAITDTILRTCVLRQADSPCVCDVRKCGKHVAIYANCY